MNAKQHYTLAYRVFRQSKGSSCLNGSVKAIRKAWDSYRDNFLYVNAGMDPIKTAPGYFNAGYSLEYAKSKIRLLYRFNTDFTQSKACNWSKQYQLLLASQALLTAADLWRDSLVNHRLHGWVDQSCTNLPPRGQYIISTRLYRDSNAYIRSIIDWQEQYQIGTK